MFTHSKEFQEILVDGQLLYAPSTETWQALLSDTIYQGYRIPAPDLLAKKVANNQKYPQLLSTLGIMQGHVMFYELLHHKNNLYRVFVEAVTCEHCGYRASLSATPGVAEIYWGCPDPKAAKSRSYSLPNLSCNSCQKPFQRRYTVWQANETAA